MARSSVSTLISDVKVFGDYNISGDTDLDSMVLKAINYAFKMVRSFMAQAGIWEGLTAVASFKTIAGQAYIDPTLAHIVGNAATFTGVAGDTVTVTVDGTATAGISLAAATTVALVVTAINTAVGSTVASEDDNGYLMITSLVAGTSSAVTIADTAGTPTARLFAATADKTQSAITDILEIIKLTDRTNDRDIIPIPYQRLISLYPDPDTNKTTTPDFYARFSDYIYFGPTPSAGIRFYFSYVKSIAELVSTDTMPIDTDYDPLVVSLALEWLYTFLDPKDRATILTAKERTADLKKVLITDAIKRYGVINQSALRGDALDAYAISPRTAE